MLIEGTAYSDLEKVMIVIVSKTHFKTLTSLYTISMTKLHRTYPQFMAHKSQSKTTLNVQIAIYERKQCTEGLVYDLRCCRMRRMESTRATITEHPAMMRAGW